MPWPDQGVTVVSPFGIWVRKMFRSNVSNNFRVGRDEASMEAAANGTEGSSRVSRSLRRRFDCVSSSRNDA